LVEILGPMVEILKILGCFHMECPSLDLLGTILGNRRHLLSDKKLFFYEICLVKIEILKQANLQKKSKLTELTKKQKKNTSRLSMYLHILSQKFQGLQNVFRGKLTVFVA
jgi:hypothetical protein